MNDNILNYIKQGVQFTDKSKVVIKGSLKCGKNVKIDINSIFEGDVVIGDNVDIQSNCIIKDSVINDNTVIRPFTSLSGSVVGQNCTIGPYANLRKDSIIMNNVSIGNYVEIKNSRIGSGSRINHLSFVGDTIMMENVTIGAGTITCNHDGKKHNTTLIGKAAYIGSGCKLIAPIEIGSNATIGSGSIITKDVPSDKLTVSRSKQVVIKNWSRK